MSKNRNTRKALTALIASIVIWCICIVAEMEVHGLSYSAKSIAQLHAGNAIIYFFECLLFLFPIATFIISKKISSAREELVKTMSSVNSNTAEISKFTENLIHGETDHQEYSFDANDKIGVSLLKLKKHLEEKRVEEERRKREDEQRNWATSGIAKFGELLRQDNDDLDQLSFNIISNIVKYLNANQGGFFLTQTDENGEKYFGLSACYAYSRKKFMEKRIEWGEGLVGACGLEMATIYITDIPDEYIKITSGLGTANPKAILITPLILNDEIHGVMEIASFNELENFEIEFVEKVAESIAVVISSAKINLHTAKLLRESQQQAEMLSEQEEIMRQNMEELKATQEEVAKQSAQFENFTNSVNHTLIRAEFDTTGTLIYANTKFLNKLEYTANSDVEGKHISRFIDPKDMDWFEDTWTRLSTGGKHFEGDMKHITRTGKEVWTHATYVCVRDSKQDVIKILLLATDITEQKKRDLNYQSQIEAVESSTLKMELDTSGNFIVANKNFLSTLEYSLDILTGKSVFDLLPSEEKASFRKIWQDIIAGNFYKGQIRIIGIDKSTHWLQCTFSALRDMYGDILKVLFIGYDITEQKNMEIEAQKQSEQLKIQDEQLRKAQDVLSQKLEEAKREMKQQFEEIETIKIRNEKTLEGALDAIITINKQSEIEFFNRAAEDLWGYSRDEVLGKQAKMLFSPETIESDEFIAAFVDPVKDPFISERREANILSKSGEELAVLFLFSDARVGDDYTVTAFIQNIEVELF